MDFTVGIYITDAAETQHSYNIPSKCTSRLACRDSNCRDAENRGMLANKQWSQGRDHRLHREAYFWEMTGRKVKDWSWEIMGPYHARFIASRRYSTHTTFHIQATADEYMILDPFITHFGFEDWKMFINHFQPASLPIFSGHWLAFRSRIQARNGFNQMASRRR